MEDTHFNILIIEDNSGLFPIIRDRLNATLKELAYVYPNQMTNAKTMYNFSHLLTVMEARKFPAVVDHYGEIDFFIIDNEILSIKTIGTEFRSFLKNINYRNGNYKIIFVTATPKNGLLINDWDEENESYIDKQNANVPGNILNELLKFGLIDLKKIPKKGKNLFTVGELLHFLWNGVVKKSELIIDKIIIITFYILIVVATLLGGYKVSNGFLRDSGLIKKPKFEQVSKNFLDSQKVIKKSDATELANSQFGNNNTPVNNKIDLSKTGKNKLVADDSSLGTDETEILTTAEHIYLYLLPIFIIFGFFNYYKGYIRRSLLSGQIGDIKEGTSTKAMRLTKVLFVSSIISYVLIKVIQEIFSPTPNMIKLIGGGILILVLIVYFLFLEKDSQRD